MHVLLRYFESRPDQTREARVKETLRTMGASIMVGGFTTLLGVLPLVLSKLEIFLTVFYAFFAMIALGLTHGLILLPVVLSYVGPTMTARGHHLAPTPDFPDTPAPSNASRQAKPAPTVAALPASEAETSTGVDNEDISTPRTLVATFSWMKDVTDEVEV